MIFTTYSDQFTAVQRFDVGRLLSTTRKQSRSQIPPLPLSTIGTNLNGLTVSVVGFLITDIRSPSSVVTSFADTGAVHQIWVDTVLQWHHQHRHYSQGEAVTEPILLQATPAFDCPTPKSESKYRNIIGFQQIEKTFDHWCNMFACGIVEV